MPDGTFILADIGGYTTFLTDVGIEHAKEITSHLFNGLFEVDQETWKVGNIEGDCLFLYSDSPKSPQDVFAYVRRLYERFRESIEEVASGSTCRCGACDRSGDLTLKFVVHGGAFDIQTIVGRNELIGPDIVVAHRLLKNSVPAREYVLATTPLAEIAEASGLGATPGRGEYGDIGAVDYVYIDFRTVREAYEKSREIYLTEADADVAVSMEIAALGKMIQTGEATPAASGTKFTLYYSLDPAAPMTDEEARSLFLDSVRQRAENDVRGLKVLCEAEARAGSAAGRGIH